MDTDRLREFKVIADSGSFKEAASRLGVAPNVLSTRFRAFENSLGTTLIHRNAHSFELTSSGRVLYERSGELLRQYDAIINNMCSVRDSSYRRLKLQLCAQSMPVELGPYLDKYCRQYPSLFLGLYDENTCRIREGLQSGKIDIVFAVGRDTDFVDIPGRIRVHTFPKLKVHVPDDHPLASQRSIWFRELDGETFVLYPKMLEHFTRDLQKSILDKSGINYEIYDESHSPFFYDLLVPVGKGISLWSWNFRSAPNTSLLTIKDADYATYMYMLYDPDSSNPTVMHFIDGFLSFRESRK